MSVFRSLPLSCRDAPLAARRVRIWTMRAAEDVRRARASGRFSGAAGACPRLADVLARGRACAWNQKRMVERIPDFFGAWPVWIWAKRLSWRRLRAGHVLLSAVVPSARSLWSDYELWHLPINGRRSLWTKRRQTPGRYQVPAPLPRRRPSRSASTCGSVGCGGWSALSGMVQGCCNGLTRPRSATSLGRVRGFWTSAA